MKTLILLVILLFMNILVFGQLTTDELLDFKLGSTFSEAKTDIEKQFKGNIDIQKGSYLDAYRIESPSWSSEDAVTFDYYGASEYKFQFVKNKLTGIKIVFSYTVNEKYKFIRLINALFPDLSKNKKLTSSNFKNYDTKKVIETINKKCNVGDTSEQFENFGTRYFYIKEKNKLNNKYLGVNIMYGMESGSKKVYDDNTEKSQSILYHGCELRVTLNICSLDLVGLETQENETIGLEYREVTEEKTKINLINNNGVYELPVNINNTLTLNFVLDAGASDVSISPDVFLVLYKAGTIKDEDFIGSQVYKFADGSSAKSSVFNMRSITIGNKTIENVRTSISNSIDSPLLLGQSALKKFGSYKIDNEQNLLIVN